MKNTDVKKIAFLCGARDFHAMDWYNSAKQINPNIQIPIITDLIGGEGFSKITKEEDSIYKLIILDKFLFKKQSSIGDKWRNVLKLILLPIQAVLLRIYSKKINNSVFFAHGMYYLVLARLANVEYVGTPQGSEILIRPFKSCFYRYFAIYGLSGAKYLTVDSIQMQEGIKKLTQKSAIIIQNGIDLESILDVPKVTVKRKNILSIRGYTKLYRIDEILKSRNLSTVKTPLIFLFPFYDNFYLQQCNKMCNINDSMIGRLPRLEMYQILMDTKLVISIPMSDSSPRSVYEAIFCGCIVGITYNPYYDILPECMKNRIIIIDLNDPYWFKKTLDEANIRIINSYVPSDNALEMFDQLKSYKRIQNLLLE